MSQNLKKLTVKNINNWKLKILKKNFKFNSLFSPNNQQLWKKMMCIIDLAWESLSKNLEANWNFFLFLSLPVQFLTTEKKNPILLEQVCVKIHERKNLNERRNAILLCVSIQLVFKKLASKKNLNEKTKTNFKCFREHTNITHWIQTSIIPLDLLYIKIADPCYNY